MSARLPIPGDSLPLATGAAGEAVRDVQRRLRALGYDIAANEDGSFGPSTTDAVRCLQEARRLQVDGICGPQTWAALVEAGFRPGDRLLYLRSPMLRGDDVADLQGQLCAVGFDTQKVDGIFGPNTERALQDFQRNSGLTTDGVCGRDTLATLHRLGDRTNRGARVAELRQQEDLRAGASRGLEGRQLVVGEYGGLEALADATSKRLSSVGAHVVILHHPDGSVQATEANELGAAAYVGFDIGTEPTVTVAYFATSGFTSVGGLALATRLADSLAPVGLGPVTIDGMRLPVLRETRMPAVRCSLGSASRLVPRMDAVAAATQQALEAWIAAPAGPPAQG